MTAQAAAATWPPPPPAPLPTITEDVLSRIPAGYHEGLLNLGSEGRNLVLHSRIAEAINDGIRILPQLGHRFEELGVPSSALFRIKPEIPDRSDPRYDA